MTYIAIFILLAFAALAALLASMLCLYLLMLGLWLAFLCLVAIPLDLLFLLRMACGARPAQDHAWLTLGAFDFLGFGEIEPSPGTSLLAGALVGYVLHGEQDACNE